MLDGDQLYITERGLKRLSVKNLTSDLWQALLTLPNEPDTIAKEASGDLLIGSGLGGTVYRVSFSPGASATRRAVSASATLFQALARSSRPRMASLAQAELAREELDLTGLSNSSNDVDEDGKVNWLDTDADGDGTPDPR